ncbi:MAG: hypothetical protein H7Y04_07095 [Verrucomicrobia bacterium]|nr:hypothetical protein [Cytophagales bacterium]
MRAGMQHQRGQTRNPIIKAKRADKWGLPLVLLPFLLLLFFLCIQKKSKKPELTYKAILAHKL